MTLWLERQEKIFRHDTFIAWRLQGSPPSALWEPPPLLHRRRIQMTKHPSRKKVSLREAVYGAVGIRDALVNYLVRSLNPQMTRRQIEDEMESFHIPFQSVGVYHKIKFWVQDDDHFSGRTQTLDSVHVRPARSDKHGKQICGRFDAVLYREAAEVAGIKGES